MSKRATNTVCTHWGIYQTAPGADGRLTFAGDAGDPDASPIGQAMAATLDDPARIAEPMVRRSFLDGTAGGRPERRGLDPFVPVSWNEALDLVASRLKPIIAAHGNQAIFGGSYGWASAGRFHHASAQLHRFLNAIGGYTASLNTYSFAAAEVILPYVTGARIGLEGAVPTWDEISANTDLVVSFGGLSWKNAQCNSGGTAHHGLKASVAACRASGVDFVTVSPIRDDTVAEAAALWLSLNPNTDVALILALIHVLDAEELCDLSFARTCAVGLDELLAYVRGTSDCTPKSPTWAQAITAIPAADIIALARRMAAGRTLLAMSWSLQRAEGGEHAYWALIALATVLGQIGLPGGGFGFGYGSVNAVGSAPPAIKWPAFDKGKNPVGAFIPVARIADMLLNPGGSFVYRGATHTYPEIHCVLWAGGNPFHHHQDLRKLITAWRRPDMVVVNESWWTATARHADVVLPVATQLERDDICFSSRDNFVSPSHQVAAPFGASRTDFDIFADLAGRFGAADTFTTKRSTRDWLVHLYGEIVTAARALEIALPDFDVFWSGGPVILPDRSPVAAPLQRLRDNPEQHRLQTPSGKIELYSATIAGFGDKGLGGHPRWDGTGETLLSPAAHRFPLHLITCQPSTKLHSQLDQGPVSRAAKVAEREPVRLNPADARARGIADGDVVVVHNDRGACLAGAVLSADVRTGVAQMATGAWFDPYDDPAWGLICCHGNPNMVTHDRPSSPLGQGCAAHSCLVDVTRYEGTAPPLTCYDPPTIEPRSARPSL